MSHFFALPQAASGFGQIVLTGCLRYARWTTATLVRGAHTGSCQTELSLFRIYEFGSPLQEGRNEIIQACAQVHDEFEEFDEIWLINVNI